MRDSGNPHPYPKPRGPPPFGIIWDNMGFYGRQWVTMVPDGLTKPFRSRWKGGKPKSRDSAGSSHGSAPSNTSIHHSNLAKVCSVNVRSLTILWRAATFGRQATAKYLIKLSKKAMVFFRPSLGAMDGSQPGCSLAGAIPGHRRVGSSSGQTPRLQEAAVARNRTPAPSRTTEVSTPVM